MAISILDDIYKTVLKSIRGAAAHSDLIDNLFENPAVRDQIVEALRAGDGNIEDAIGNILGNTDGLDDATRNALRATGPDSFRAVLKSASIVVGRHGAKLDELGGLLQRGTYENAQAAQEAIQGFLSRNLDEGNDLYKALDNAAPALARNATDASIRRGALGFLRQAPGTTLGAARTGWNVLKKGFTKTEYQIFDEQTQMFQSATRAQYNLHRAEGLRVATRSGAFSPLRAGLSVTTGLVVNDVLGGVPGDLAVSVVTAVGVPTVGWIGKRAFGGATEVSESVGGEDWWESNGEPSDALTEPEWVRQALEEGVIQQEERLPVDVDDPNTPFDPEIYRQLYYAENSPVDRNIGFVTPERYAEIYPQLQAIAQNITPAATSTNNNNNAGADEDAGADPATVTSGGQPLGTGIDWDNLSGGNLTNAFETASQALERGDLDLGFQDRIMFGLASTLAGIFNAINIGGWADGLINNFQKFAVDMAKDEIETQFGDRFPDMIAQRNYTPAGTAMAPG